MDLDMSTLDSAWQATYELAWEAWRAGTIPIGAVVADREGRVIARGRNRIFDPDRPPGQLAGAWIAHAEVNALLQLPANHYEDFAVTSTTEPCLMCAGAITMSLRGRVVVRYAVEDPIAGGVEAATHSPQGQRRDLRFHRLEHPGFVRFADALNLAESIRRVPDGVVAAYYRQRRPGLFSCAMELESVLRRFLFTDVALGRVVNKVETVLRNHPDFD
jgi:tRNA(Arg) A34 adenosine deaminase TadA